MGRRCVRRPKRISWALRPIVEEARRSGYRRFRGPVREQSRRLPRDGRENAGVFRQHGAVGDRIVADECSTARSLLLPGGESREGETVVFSFSKAGQGDPRPGWRRHVGREPQDRGEMPFSGSDCSGGLKAISTPPRPSSPRRTRPATERGTRYDRRNRRAPAGGANEQTKRQPTAIVWYELINPDPDAPKSSTTRSQWNSAERIPATRITEIGRGDGGFAEGSAGRPMKCGAWSKAGCWLYRRR